MSYVDGLTIIRGLALRQLNWEKENLPAKTLAARRKRTVAQIKREIELVEKTLEG